MSYLHLPRLVFSGDFISDVSTVNNDTQHYNNDTFESSFQKFGKGRVNGWWNPEGGATFGFQDCSIRQILDQSGESKTDPLLDAAIVCGPDGRNSGKMVDLDPQQQGCSELWGVVLRILTKQGDVLLEGKIKTTAFRDLQTRQQSGAAINGQPFGGTWTSVLEDIIWGDKATSSPFLSELKARTQENKISINLNAYGYYYNHAEDGRFSLGRINGTLAPWFSKEPETFAPARRLYGISVSGTYSNGLPIIFFNNTNFLFEKADSRLTIDFGASFPIVDTMGGINLKANLVVAVSKVAITSAASNTSIVANPDDLVLIGPVNYQNGADWLKNTNGIVSYDLKKDASALLEHNQLLLLSKGSDGQYNIIARESVGGFLLRADNFVQRLDTNQTNTVKFYAYQFGKPLPQSKIDVALEPATATSQKADNVPPICDIPGNNFPKEGLTFKSTVTTDKDGLALMPLTGNSIKSPRIYLDGQIYTLDYAIEGHSTDVAIGPLSNDNVLIHLRDDFKIPEKPVWADIKDTMTQFANLYPVMSKYFIDFSKPDQLIAKKDILKFAFTREITDPIYMPATRDLSENKRLTILKWLEEPYPLIGPEMEAAKLKKKPTSKSAYKNPAASNQPLTDNQQRLKNAVRAKNGSDFNAVSINNLFEF